MARGIGELITCPEILECKRLHLVLSGAAKKTVKRFDVALGPSEVMRLHSVRYQLAVVGAASVTESVAFGLSYKDLAEVASSTTNLSASLAARADREDLFFDTYWRRKLHTEAGVDFEPVDGSFYFDPCKCLVRSPSLDFESFGAVGTSINLQISLYYTKIGVISGVLTQLLKVYNDVKRIYRQL